MSEIYSHECVLIRAGGVFVSAAVDGLVKRVVGDEVPVVQVGRGDKRHRMQPPHHHLCLRLQLQGQGERSGLCTCEVVENLSGGRT